MGGDFLRIAFEPDISGRIAPFRGTFGDQVRSEVTRKGTRMLYIKNKLMNSRSLGCGLKDQDYFFGWKLQWIQIKPSWRDHWSSGWFSFIKVKIQNPSLLLKVKKQCYLNISGNTIKLCIHGKQKKSWANCDSPKQRGFTPVFDQPLLFNFLNIFSQISPARIFHRHLSTNYRKNRFHTFFHQFPSVTKYCGGGGLLFFSKFQPQKQLV